MSQPFRRGSRPRLRISFVCSLALGAASPAWAEAPAASRAAPGDSGVSLEQLLDYAESHAPSLRLATERQGYGQAAAADAGTFLRQNPTLQFGIGPRFDSAGQVDFDFQAGLSQPVEISGSRGQRREAAERLTELLGAETSSQRWALRREVTVAYGVAAMARERARLAARVVAFARELCTVAQRRLSAGDVNAIDAQLAETDLVQARQMELRAEQAHRVSRIELATLTGWPLETPPDAAESRRTPEAVPSLDQVIKLAADKHPELVARRAAVAESQARLKLAEKEAWPMPVLGAQVSREGSAGAPANYIVLGTIGLPLSLWQRNQGEVARSHVDEEVARLEESVATRALRARLTSAHAELESATERLRLYLEAVQPRLEQSLVLLQRGFAAGEFSVLNVAVARERLLAAEREGLDAYADYYRALAELEFAAGAELNGGGR
jgi:cobalt-zinc-cadmium efflux system outer membrane protein